MAKNKSNAQRKSGSGEKIFLAVITFINLLLSVILALINRREVIHAVRENDDVKVLLTAKDTSKQ